MSDDPNRTQRTGEWVTIAQFTSLPEAGIARGVLEGAGLECRLADEGTVGVAWHLSNAVGGVKVQVDAADEEEARRILEAEAVVEPAEPALPRQEDEGGEAEEPYLSERDADAKRALAAALFGFFLPVLLHLWSLTLLVQVPGRKGRLSGRGRVYVAVALALDLGALATLVAIVLRWPG